MALLHVRITRRLIGGLIGGLLPIRTPPTLAAEFCSAAFDRPNYSSAIVASRDTNVSPKEAYDIISERAQPPTGVSNPRALDLGAGAGVSTQLLWLNGFRSIEAVDPSRMAWDENVASIPAGVTFSQTSDDAYLARRSVNDALFDLVLVNYAINSDKAAEFAKTLLTAEGYLLAPVNLQRDYLFAQEFRLMNRLGEVIWRKDKVGTCEVTFQPDFTSSTCSGQWCPQFRGLDSLTTLNLK